LGQYGYCGLRRNDSGKLAGVSSEVANLSWYHDPLPTNCVGAWVCAASTDAGYPEFTHSRGAEWGCDNLAVFLQACTFNCLYCQNWQFKRATFKAPTTTARDLAAGLNDRTTCVCYFGGDPAPQLPFTLNASRLARESRPDRILRICWETNGSMAPELLDRMMSVALETGGCVKFDIKAFDHILHRALTGVDNRRTLENFKRAALTHKQRPVPPPVIASTLMVPGYIDTTEVRAIADWIVSVHPDIPYSLLGFHPDYEMRDLPRTSHRLAEACRQAAFDAGLTRVHIGNVHLLR
jgi:pyruvate formate lyase activating enzyme